MFSLLLTLITFACSASEHNPHEAYEMKWLWKESMFSARYHNNETTFAIAFRNEIPDQIPALLHHLFNKQELSNETFFVYNYGESFEIPHFPESNGLEQTHYDPRYHVHTPLIQHDSKPQNISIKKLRKIMQKKSIAWYTGAGISACVVPAMAMLETSLGIIGASRDERSCNFITNALQNPQQIAAIMHAFYTSCLHGDPTPAHKAISEYEKEKNCLVFTENLDMLHEHAGTIPARIEDPALFKQNITTEKLQNIDIMICVGLSHDDRGLLGYYKHHNPAGIIIALCLEQPTYLGETDYLLQGDAQEIIPKLTIQ